MASHPAGSAATSPAAPNSSDPQRRSLSPMESPKALSWAQSSSSSSSMTLPASFPHGRLVSYADDTQILDSAPSKHSDIQADLCQGSKKVQDPGFAESKVWDLEGSWTLHVLFAVGLWKPRTSKLCYAARPWKPRTSRF